MRNGVGEALELLVGLGQLGAVTPELLIGVLAIRDVLVGAQHTDDIPAGAVQRRLAGAEPAVGSIRPNLGLLVAEFGLAALRDLAVGGHIGVGVCPPVQIVVGLAHDVQRGGDAGVARAGLVAAQVASLPILPEHALGNMVQNQLQHLARFAQVRGLQMDAAAQHHDPDQRQQSHRTHQT